MNEIFSDLCQMQKYICLLRGINVGGNRKMKMADLKKELADLGLEHIKTYIQSGNVSFQAKEKDEQKLEAQITKMIADKFGFDVPVMVRQSDELQQIFQNCPFVEGEEDLRMIHVAFLSEEPSEAAFAEMNLEQYAPDKAQLFKRAIYIHYPNGSYKSKLSGNLLEKKLGLKITARNWKTMIKLKAMLED